MEVLKALELMGREWLDPGALTLCLLGASVVVSLMLLRNRSRKHREKKARELIFQAQQLRERSFEEAERALKEYRHKNPSLESRSIVSLSMSELSQKLQEGSLSAEEVFYSFVEKTLELQRKLNCCTGMVVDSLEQLRTLDSCRKGMLYGVPISVKENLFFKKQDSSIGVVKFLNQPSQEDSVLVQVLKKQGAIPFVRTNVPQAMFSYECSNPIFGQSLNPYNVKKTCGGSSGGEAALIGGGGSVMGVGSDIAGSIRVPASFCGICSLKPTAGRLSMKGCRAIYRGQKTVLSTCGPMGKDVETLALFMKAVLCDHMFSLDPTVPPTQFNEEVYRSTKPLRIGFYDHLDHIPITSSMTRAVQEVKALLEKAGHTLVPYKPVRVAEIMELANRGILADGCTTFIQQLEGSPIDPLIHLQVSMYGLPIWVKKLLAVVLKPLWPKNAKTFNNLSGVGSAAGLWRIQASIEDRVNDTIAEWRRLDIDVVLCPNLGPAYNLSSSAKLYCMLPYAAIYNLLNFCAGVVPVSTVTEEDERNLAHLGRGGAFERALKEACGGALGLPVAVQCVALPWQEELCLRFMREVETLARNKN